MHPFEAAFSTQSSSHAVQQQNGSSAQTASTHDEDVELAGHAIGGPCSSAEWQVDTPHVHLPLMHWLAQQSAFVWHAFGLPTAHPAG